MDSASSLPYPGSRVLAGWWRQLQPHHPVSLWVGYLFVHRVEGLVECAEPRVLDPLTLHLLMALAVDRGDAVSHDHGFESLVARLHLPPPALHQVLIGLEVQGLVRRCSPARWCLSERGQTILRDRADLAPRHERRAFPFVERLSAAGRRLAPPHYLPLHECPGAAWAVDDMHRFDVALLPDSIDRPVEWKVRCDFPAGVRSMVAASADELNDAWEQIIVDRPQRVAIALTPVGMDGAVLGFAAQADGWKLLDAAPVLGLPKGTGDVLPELVVPPAAWDEAWRLWCRQRSLPLSEAEACRLSFDGIHLDVHAPESFVQRLRAAHSEILHEECGLLAGDGYLRAAALLRLQA